jgi:hypothetical protein
MKLVTFGVDDTHSLVVTFPVLVKHFHSESLKLYELETVPVPIVDTNQQAASYSEVQVAKPYLAINGDYYIDLRIQELRMCKQIHFEYFCEELFLVKHKTKSSCESSLYFDLPPDKIINECVFKYYYNTTVQPAVLDGGDIIVLANIVNQKRLICTDNYNLAQPLPSHQYVMVNRSILCNCEIEAGLMYILRSLGSCSDSSHLPPMYFTLNLAFYEKFKKLLPYTDQEPLTEPVLEEPVFPVFLEPPPDLLHPPETLRDLLDEMERKKDSHRADLEEINADTTLDHTIELLEHKPTKIFIFCGAVSAFIAVGIILFIAYKHAKVQALLAASVLTPTAEAVTTISPEYWTACPSSWPTIVLVILIGLIVVLYIYNMCKSMALRKGYKYDKRCDIYLFISSPEHYVPVKLTTVPGQIHQFRQDRPLLRHQITLDANRLWDVLHVAWSTTIPSTSFENRGFWNVNVLHQDKRLSLPHSITVPLLEKYRVRTILKKNELSISLMIKQGVSWYSLTKGEVDTPPEPQVELNLLT